MNKTMLLPAGALVAAALTFATTRLRAQPAGDNRKPSVPAPAVVKGTVRSIRMPEFQPDLPPGPHRDEAVLYCGICHTPRYIVNQPPFSRATWLSEVIKMRTTFSGPIPEEKVADLMEYLMAVRGAGAQTPAATPARSGAASGS